MASADDDQGHGESPDSSWTTLEAPGSFDFPFTPYDIQHAFMSRLFACIENGKIGIFESPTGTGKSLSLLTGALTWLKNDDQRSEEIALKTLDSNDAGVVDTEEPDWVREHERTRLLTDLQSKKRAREERLERYRRLEQERNESHASLKRKRQNLDQESSINDDDEDFLPDTPRQESDENVSENVRKLLQQYSNRGKILGSEEEDQEPNVRTIFFTSRTHSQLSQLVQELRKTTFVESTSLVPLASRKNLCINADVRKLQDVNLINEKCLDLQQSTTSQGKRCPYLSKNDPSQMQDLRDRILAVPRDIEELVVLGQDRKCCPFYASRMAVPSANLVTLPYNLLLSKEARVTIDIDLKDQVVIVDEAHNLVDTICALHTKTLTRSQVVLAQEQVSVYISKFRARLRGTNLMYVQQLNLLLERLLASEALLLQNSQGKSDQSIMTVNEFIQRTKIDQLNYARLQTYLDESHLARKIQRFSSKVKERESGEKSHGVQGGTPILHSVEGLLRALINPDDDGRILFGGTGADWTIKYLLLNPSDQFKSVVEESRSVILAGGTMQPVSEMTSQLFSYLDKNRLELFSCSHVIPKDNLLTLILGMGPTKVELSMNFERRKSNQVIDEIGLAIANLSQLIPAGVVVFFPSYGYLEDVFRRWGETKLVDRLTTRKRLFRESKDGSGVEGILGEYTAHLAQKGNGALLAAVVGGKLSEGINFSDDLGRGIVVVGMPFPNSQSVELQEKMKFIGGLAEGRDKKSIVRDYYQNLCMKATNQSVGRAIRHANDYATIVLLDARFEQASIRAKLPKWIDQSVVTCPNFGFAVRQIAPFFKAKAGE